ncbi:hypothetical protein A3H80_00995 [Candidatus Roizmanbacteria bacterium RIFCSPLOWO2_02_FULL_37_19]|uniref:Lactamase n=1 Tax=Candidatus Roizmanbacteria bacterium RIFCSPHIGHO2_02_FULL_37_24 TaxID=1802037 RepID=A0A1F7GUC7_9BACT|nr:MAG: hypothetical protein A2862_03135 [Candidatus Roizmanbacteria bacterium RIFCSPHIGHO2_01_FULL_38_41]OGK22513.1 MAG: hypothetical protein A3C24_05110 [Candidatus Roizmanbacteria bacterium RIFCSPHIGHO2_02_FULL_37_24]OGK33913.1 MAG: hypothetical protein A3E10_01895 [Candidatus Roizmanbacteria bacterium RIFCSPHIGHO2_12_FULL_37_23]OGK43397.1 MAG: hypothetical protein A2956_04375 [Candidatus Roizmanbacteria bacterium RIFCSPLOWO2_01_FULL_37_57]OGK54177.1 MAG: hypothetical protein A3H80_00995 [Ca
MDIKYLGHSSFFIRGQKGKVVTDPYDPAMMARKFPKVEADIVTISHEHQDHNAARLIEGNPLVVNLPGEYEKNGVRIYGFDTYHDKNQGSERGINTLYKIEIDDISILHCGDLGHVLSNELIEQIDGVDILMIPVGGFYTIGPDEASDIVSKIEPAVVIPMHYKTDIGFTKNIMDKLSPVSDFIQAVGVSGIEPVNKFSIKKQDIGEEMSVVVMEVA